MEPLRLLVVDDHAEFRAGLEALLGASESMRIIATATDGHEAVRIALDAQPDVVLMDLNMPGVNGIDATQQIVSSSPHIKVLVLTMLEDDDSVFAAIRAGARGYLLKGARRTEILRAIEAVGAGEVIFGPGIADRVAAYFAQVGSAAPAADVFPELTTREREILRLIAGGRENSEIAAELHVSTKTVRNHASNIFMKLQVAHRAQAIVKARDAGLR